MTATARPAREASAFIAGEWIDGLETRPVLSPFDGTETGRVGWAGAAEAREAVAAAHAAMATGWPAHERAAVLERFAAGIAERIGDLSEMLAREAGKPVRAGRTEAERAVQTISLSAVEARKLGGEVIPMDASPTGVGKVGFTVRVPIGVVGAITPFNFPLNLACHKIGPAIAAGCGVVLKPADKAPLTACLLADIAADAGLPAGWLNVLVGDPVAIADVFATDPRVGLITFTGSSAIGWELRAKAPRKRVTLELGNSTPAVVDETSDPAAVARRLAGSAFGFSGQSCISTQRVYVHEDVADEFERELAAAADALVAGDPLHEDTEIGPVISADAAARIVGTIDDAVAAGARVLAGGTADGNIVRPTVLTNAPRDADVVCREVFGPVVAVERYTDFDDALAVCNDTDYGLQAAVFTQQLDRALTAARTLEFAAVLVNEVPTFRADQMPYGGIKESGNTREGPAYAIHEMTEERLVLLQPR